MQFLQISDFDSLIDSVTLDAVIDGNTTILDDAEARGIEEMSSYLRIRYDITQLFDPGSRNSIVVMRLCDIVLYHIHARISPDNIPELRKDRYTNVMDWLEKIADGFISPAFPPKEDPDKPPLRYGSTSPKQDQYF